MGKDNPTTKKKVAIPKVIQEEIATDVGQEAEIEEGHDLRVVDHDQGIEEGVLGQETKSAVVRKVGKKRKKSLRRKNLTSIGIFHLKDLNTSHRTSIKLCKLLVKFHRLLAFHRLQ